MCRGWMNHTVPVLKESLESFRRNLRLLLKIQFKKIKSLESLWTNQKFL